MMSDAVNILLILAVLGGILYLWQLAPIDATIKKIGTALVVILAIIWALKRLMGHV